MSQVDPLVAWALVVSLFFSEEVMEFVVSIVVLLVVLVASIMVDFEALVVSLVEVLEG